MKLQGTRIIHEAIDVKKYSIVEAYIDIFCKMNDFRKDYYIENGNVCFEETCHTSHSWEITRVVRPATERDQEVLNHLKLARQTYSACTKENE